MDVLTSPLSRVQLVITRDEEVEAEALLAYRREVAGTPFTFGPLPLEVELEVADICTHRSQPPSPHTVPRFNFSRGLVYCGACVAV
jgi:hypothetical protein